MKYLRISIKLRNCAEMFNNKLTMKIFRNITIIKKKASRGHVLFLGDSFDINISQHFLDIQDTANIDVGVCQ